ncbi:hypothetical protein [Lacibacter sediminis]|uniref:Uncharacterized protein n=1 Tax=Lacibacter sediminis TaxID=2760713 RepID=A0A7G5XCY2_9BACT|nr:hypothetical protein [Lacibacter sediminis]QNA43335.1 hypothetical protein H4075_14765 [Lacibacter sediminis]
MSINLLETLQIQLGYPALQKIDPNTQVVKENDETPDEHRFSQAALTAVLTALYNYSHTDIGAEKIRTSSSATTWADLIFTDNQQSVIKGISDYANYTKENVITKLNSIATAAVSIIQEQLPADATMHQVKKFMNTQRNNILPFLPAELQMGELLHDNTLDDRTNKMEGPVSSIMRAIVGSFSNGEAEKKDTVL